MHTIYLMVSPRPSYSLLDIPNKLPYLLSVLSFSTETHQVPLVPPAGMLMDL